MRALIAIVLSLLILSPAHAAKLEQFTVSVEGQPLSLWAHVVSKPRGVIVLIHGRTWSAMPDFDLQVPGEKRSIMQALNERGYSAYALDLRGYGKSPRDATGWLTPDRAANDVAAVLTWLAHEKKVSRPTLFGWSNGSVVVQLTAQRHPELISNLVLYGYPRDAAAPRPVPPTPEQPPREKNTVENAKSDFISPQVTSSKMVEAYVAAALAADPIHVDWRSLEQWAELDPAKVTVPTLLVHGERDPLAPVEAQSHLFTKLGNPDRQWIILAGGDHAALLENTAPALIAAVVNFIERPCYECPSRSIQR
jgi:pimeloyl-ACP methyl ester carboxylesterase